MGMWIATVGLLGALWFAYRYFTEQECAWTVYDYLKHQQPPPLARMEVVEQAEWLYRSAVRRLFLAGVIAAGCFLWILWHLPYGVLLGIVPQ